MPIPNHWRDTSEEAQARDTVSAQIIPFPGVRVRRVDAPVGRRILAQAIDFFILVGTSLYVAQLTSLFLTMSFADRFAAAGNAGEDLFFSLWDWAHLWLWGASFVLMNYVYHGAALYKKGRTIGKALLNLRLENSVAVQAPSLGQVLRRVSAYFLSYITFGLLSFLHDQVSDTHVVIDESKTHALIDESKKSDQP